MNKVIIKHSTVPGKIPTAADLAFGEIALNIADGRMYAKRSDGVVEPLAQSVDLKSFGTISADVGSMSATGPSQTFSVKGGSGIRVTALSGTRELVVALDNADAATLGGQASSYFSPATHLHDERYLKLQTQGGDYYTKAQVDGNITAAIDALIGGAGSAYDTLKELETALNGSDSAIASINATLATKLNASSYTAADVLAKLKTVDGASSGLDADLLDGQDSAYYLSASNLNAGTVPVARLSGIYGIGISGNAATASKLAAPYSLSLAGHASGTVSMDGSANATLTVTVANDSHTHDARYYEKSLSDARYMALSGNQTITGTKTYTDSVEIASSGALSKFTIRRTDIADNSTLKFQTTSANDAVIGQGDAGFFAIGSGSDIRYAYSGVFAVNALTGDVKWKGNATGSGSGLTNLNASSLSAGTVPISRISSTSARNSASETTLLHAKAMNDHVLSGDHDSRYVNKAGDVITGKLMLAGDGHHLGQNASIALALGDADTGFKWVSDGVFELHANAQAVANITRDAFSLNKPLNLLTNTSLEGTVNGLKVTNGANGFLEIGNRNASFTHYGSSTGKHYFYGTVESQSGFIGSGAALTSLNASNLASGTIPDARISGSYTGMSNLTGSGNVDFARFLGNASDTVTAPSFSWTGDTNTGLYRPAADTIGVSVAGVERARFSSAGISGVGTGLTSLNASNLTTGTVPIARISSTSARNSTSESTLLHAKAMNDHVASGDHDGRYVNKAGDTTTGTHLYSGDIGWIVSTSNTARQRVDARTDETSFARLHCYGISTGGATSNFRHAWYDGAAYIPVTATAGKVTFGGGLEASSLQITPGTGIALGTATPSTSYNINMNDTFSANGTRAAIYSIANISDGTLTGNRTHYGIYNSLRNDYLSTESFTLTQRAAYNEVVNGPANDEAATINTAEGSRNYVLNRANGTISSAIGCYNYVLTSRAGSTITNAYGSYNYVQHSLGAITNAYAGYFRVAGSITSNSFGIYVTGEDKNYFSGKVGIGNSNPTFPLDVNGTARATFFSGSGKDLYELDASSLTTGTVPIARISSTTSRTSSSETTLLHAKAMNDHRLSGDHDSRYVISGNQSPEYLGDLRSIAGIADPQISTTLNHVGYRLKDSGQLYCAAPYTMVALNRTSSGAGNAIDFNFRGAYVGGIYVTSSSVAYNTGSDYRLKTDIAPLQKALSTITRIPVYEYHWKSNPTSSKSMGVLAHEAQLVIPECATGYKDEVREVGKIVIDGEVYEDRAPKEMLSPEIIKRGGEWIKTGEEPVYQSVDYSKFVPLLIASIQELIEEVEGLKAQIQSQ